MKRKISELSSEEKIKTLDTLYTAVASLEGREAVKLLLRDLLTESERVMLGRRLLIAQKLLAKESERNIAKELKVGLDTIYRIQQWLDDTFPGFENAIQEMEKEFSRRKKQQTLLGRLKKKYPLHFLLFPN